MKSSIDRNYEKMRTIIEMCRQEVGMVGRKSRTGEQIPVLDNILFRDIPEKGVCVTSQFENGLCGEIFWYRNGNDIYMVHGNIRPIDHTVWLQMNKKGLGEVLHLKLKPDSSRPGEKVKKKEADEVFISPLTAVRQFYDFCFWPEYIRGRELAQENARLYEVVKEIVRFIGADFQYDLESMYA